LATEVLATEVLAAEITATKIPESLMAAINRGVA
jgi:hypothetical protein